jgi:hypothetical protein
MLSEPALSRVEGKHEAGIPSFDRLRMSAEMGSINCRCKLKDLV